MVDDYSWTGILRADLDELAAFDAMRIYLEDYWERGGKSDDSIANLLSNLSREIWADGGPGDPAAWSDWLEAIARVRQASATG